MNIIRVNEVGSTNDYIKQLNARSPLEEGSVVVTYNQSSGRGQANNKWEAEPGKNLTFSLLLLPSFIRPAEQFVLSQAVALGVVDALSSYADDLSLKWPNDIYWKNKKLGGILIETELSGNRMLSCIVGIGLNINQTRFVSNAPNPVSLMQITGLEYSLDKILKEVIANIMNRYGHVKNGDWQSLRTDYFNRLYLCGVPARYVDETGMFTGVIREVKPTGHLLIETTDHEFRTYAFKEVEFVHDV